VLAGVIGTRQYYGERGVSFTPASSEGTILVGDISHPPAQMVLFVLAGGICRPPAQMDTTTWKIRIFQTVSNGETINMKVVHPDKLLNFEVYTFLFEIILSMKLKFESLKFEIQIS
jgi:hypothetical protein